MDPRLRECCMQEQARVLSNSSSKIHQTWGPPLAELSITFREAGCEHFQFPLRMYLWPSYEGRFLITWIMLIVLIPDIQSVSSTLHLTALLPLFQICMIAPSATGSDCVRGQDVGGTFMTPGCGRKYALIIAIH